MRLSDVLTPGRLVVPLHAESLGDAARELVERLVAEGAVADVEKLDQRIAEQRPEDQVALGDRAFLLHYRTDAVRELAVAVGTSPSGVRRTVGDDETQRARIVLLIVAPPRLAARYLQVVGAFARALARPAVVEEILDQTDPAALAALPVFAEFQLPEQLTVRDIMTDHPRTVSPDTPLRQAARDMVRAGVGGLPVVDEEQRVVGMLSERELLRHLLSSYLAAAPPHAPPLQQLTGPIARKSVRDVMTRQVLCVSPDQPLAEVASLMANKDVDRVPVVREGKLVGFLTRGDITRKLIGS